MFLKIKNGLSGLLTHLNLIDPEYIKIIVASEKNMENVLSIDLESWLHVYQHIKPLPITMTSLERKEMECGYIVNATEQILEMLDLYGQQATFFVVAEIFDWYPNLIEKIACMGHEIGYHTHSHRIIYNVNILEQELEKSKKFIGIFNPKGFRAPQMHITRDCFSVLKDSGFTYSSSTYGDNPNPFPDRGNEICGIKEISVSTIFSKKSKIDFPMNLRLKDFFVSIPFGGGIYFVLLRSRISALINYVNQRGRPAIMFVHPWQIVRHKKISSPSFKLPLFFNKPFYALYLSDISKSFDKVLGKHDFISFENYFNL